MTKIPTGICLCNRRRVLHATPAESAEYLHKKCEEFLDRPNRILGAKNMAATSYLDGLDKALRDARY